MEFSERTSSNKHLLQFTDREIAKPAQISMLWLTLCYSRNKDPKFHTPELNEANLN